MPEVPVRRRERIAQHVQQAGTARIDELAERFGVSAMTIHRDLDVLAAEGWLEKTRGGARSDGLRLQERSVKLRLRQQQPQKRALARAALQHLAPGMTLAMDDSTTAAALVPQLGGTLPLTVITNFLPAINTLVEEPDIDLIVLGGQYDRNLECFDGPVVIDQLQQLRADVVVMSVAALHDGLVLHPSPDAARRKRALIDIGEKKILLVDATKFDRRASHRMCPVGLYDLVITDRDTRQADLDALAATGVEVQVVDVLPEDEAVEPVLGDVVPVRAVP